MDDIVDCPFCPFAGIIEDPKEDTFQCERPGCRIISCRKCREKVHPKMTCEGTSLTSTLMKKINAVNMVPPQGMKLKRKWQKRCYDIVRNASTDHLRRMQDVIVSSVQNAGINIVMPVAKQFQNTQSITEPGSHVLYLKIPKNGSKMKLPLLKTVLSGKLWKNNPS